MFILIMLIGVEPDNAVICPHHKLATVEFATQTTHWDGKLLKIKGSLHYLVAYVLNFFTVNGISLDSTEIMFQAWVSKIPLYLTLLGSCEFKRVNWSFIDFLKKIIFPNDLVVKTLVSSI